MRAGRLAAVAVIVLSVDALVAFATTPPRRPATPPVPEIQVIPATVETTSETTSEKTSEIIDTVELSAPDPLNDYSISDIELIARVVRAEAGNQDFRGKRLVAAVVLNRVESGAFPNTVYGVIYQQHQFSTATDGALVRAERTVNGEDFEAVELEIRDRSDPRIMYFTAGGYNASGRPAYKHGGHYFSNL